MSAAATINRQLMLLRDAADEIDQTGSTIAAVLRELGVSVPTGADLPKAYSRPCIRVSESPSLREAYLALYWAYAVLAQAVKTFEEVSE